MNRTMTPAILSCAFGVAMTLRAQEPPADLTKFLRERIGLDQGQLAAIERGEAVVKILESPSERDLGVFGVIVVAVPRQFYVSRVQDFPNSLRTPTRHAFGIFHTPARPEDVAAVTITQQDAGDIQKCKPGDCKSKMPGSDMERLVKEVDWSAPDPSAQVTTYVRQRLVEYVNAYRAHGDSALVTYDDANGTRASDAFDTLLSQSPWVYQDVPSLRQYLAGYPHVQMDGVTDAVFWSDDRAPRLRPTLSVNHVVTYAPPEHPNMTVVATKQIYANHYTEAAFDFTAAIDRGAGGDHPGIYLLMLRRFRLDEAPSGTVRHLMRGQFGNQARDDLQRQRSAAEQAFGHGH
ncbi:MAG TPA: hypothetical protein VG454_16275 [Gemmatimonadales bacterium]|nr:hypothetical protein [Gemmatimonadales bacterium]